MRWPWLAVIEWRRSSRAYRKEKAAFLAKLEAGLATQQEIRDFFARYNDP